MSCGIRIKKTMSQAEEEGGPKMKEVKVTFTDNGYVVVSVKNVTMTDMLNALSALAGNIRDQTPPDRTTDIDMAISAVTSRHDVFKPQGE